MARSDFRSLTNTQETYYSDVSMNFDKNPFSNNLAIVSNDQSIKQSLKCLILTSLGERLYDSTIGSDIHRQLFEPNDDIAINTIRFAIENTIKFNEQRVNIVSLLVVAPPDQDVLTVTLVFTIINDPTPITLNLILKRVR